jgi:hypothetical protein
MVRLQPKLSLKPYAAFELPNIGLFAIIHALSALFCLRFLCLGAGFKQFERGMTGWVWKRFIVEHRVWIRTIVLSAEWHNTVGPFEINNNNNNYNIN